MRLYRGLCLRARPFFSRSYDWRKVGQRSYQDGGLFRRSLLPRKIWDCPRIKIHSKIDTMNCWYGVEREGRILKITWADGETAAFHAVWLRHNCQCPSCLTSSNQKAIDPAILHPNTTVHLNESSVLGGVLSLTWSCGHSGYISEDWLRNNVHSSPIAEGASGEEEDSSRPTLTVKCIIVNRFITSHHNLIGYLFEHRLNCQS